MKACVLHGIGDFRCEEVPMPMPGVGEALVRVMAAGVCGSDIPRIFETGAHRHPLIPGHEFSGIVEAVGAEQDTRWTGKRVGVFPLVPCLTCDSCRKKQYEMCKSYGYLGSRQDGGFAEYAIVPVCNLIALPEMVSFEAAAMLEPMAVAVHAVRRAAVNGEDTVAVCGLGTIGRFLAMTLRAFGIRKLMLIGNKESQQRFAEKVEGASFFDMQGADARRRLVRKCSEDGMDVFFECVGKNETSTLGIECAAPAGRVVLVGNPASDMTLRRDVYWQILRKQLLITGTWNSSFTGDDGDDWHEALWLLETGAIDPVRVVSHRLPLAELEKGLLVMRDKTEDFCKIMVVME